VTVVRKTVPLNMAMRQKGGPDGLQPSLTEGTERGTERTTSGDGCEFIGGPEQCGADAREVEICGVEVRLCTDHLERARELNEVTEAP